MERKRPEDEQPQAGIFVDHASVVHDASDEARKSQDLLKRYGLALALAGLALFLRGVLPLKEGTSIYQLPLAAIVLSAWYGGRGPGLLASLICITGVSYWFIPPVNSFATAPEHVLPFSIFLGLCLLLSEFGAGRRRAEHALRASDERLRASEARFRTFVDRATDAFFLLDEQLTVVDVNRQACESLGWSREELIGMHPRDFDAGLDEPSVARLGKRAAAGETITFDTRHRRKDGTVFPVEIRASTFQQAGQLVLSRARARHQRAQARRGRSAGKGQALQMARTELARVSRLTTLGELTTSIVHEVSQPLGRDGRQGRRRRALACRRAARYAEARSALDNIAADGKRAREVIARIRALTKRQAPRMELLDVNRKIREVLALAEHELRRQDIVLRTELDRTLPRVAGDRVQLQQVLLNLIVNAIEAMSGVHDRPRELTIVSRQERRERRGGRGARFRPRPGRGRCAAGVRGVLHDEGAGHRHRLVHQPLDRRGARRAAVGNFESASRGGVPLLAARCQEGAA